MLCHAICLYAYSTHAYNRHTYIHIPYTHTYYIMYIYPNTCLASLLTIFCLTEMNSL